MADFPCHVTVNAELHGELGSRGWVKTQEGHIPLDLVKSIYYRRPTGFIFPDDVTGSGLAFATAEARRGFGGNHPGRMADAEFKPAQLSAAASCGLTVPRTLLTSDPDQARLFCQVMEEGVVYKPLSAENIVTEDELQLVFTSRISANDFNDADLSLTINLLQEWVPKRYDARVTVVGQRIFGVAIHASSPDAYLDWRIDYSALRYEPVELPACVSKSILAYMKFFDLLYGAFDFAFTDDQWYFLECNANGQFGWIEAETNYRGGRFAGRSIIMTPCIALFWQKRARALADSLAAGGVLRSAVWRAAVEQTPRHLFVPASIDVTDTGMTTQEMCADAWLDRMYSDVTLVVQRRSAPSPPTADRPGAALPTSSSTMPSLMVEMLEALDVRDGHRVLEIGTGTGYNAALLSHRLGAENVVSIDIDPDLVHAAGQRLNELGYSPTLVAGDGQDGVPDHGPYDRIIATCAVPEIPLAWIEQLAPEGTMLINLRGEIAGVLCLLSKHNGDDDEVIGPVIRSGGNFMWLRRELSSPLRRDESSIMVSARKVARRLTALSPVSILGDNDFFWWLQLELPGLRVVSSTEVFDPLEKVSRPGLLIYTNDGAHAQAINESESDGHYRIIQSGCRRIWDTVEIAYETWNRLGRPDARRFCVVANSTIQFVSLDSDSNWMRWPLPLV